MRHTISPRLAAKTPHSAAADPPPGLGAAELNKLLYSLRVCEEKSTVIFLPGQPKRMVLVRLQPLIFQQVTVISASGNETLIIGCAHSNVNVGYGVICSMWSVEYEI